MKKDGRIDHRRLVQQHYVVRKKIFVLVRRKETLNGSRPVPRRLVYTLRRYTAERSRYDGVITVPALQKPQHHLRGRTLSRSGVTYEGHGANAAVKKCNGLPLLFTEHETGPLLLFRDKPLYILYDRLTPRSALLPEKVEYRLFGAEVVGVGEISTHPIEHLPLHQLLYDTLYSLPLTGKTELFAYGIYERLPLYRAASLSLAYFAHQVVYGRLYSKRRLRVDTHGAGHLVGPFEPYPLDPRYHVRVLSYRLYEVLSVDEGSVYLGHYRLPHPVWGQKHRQIAHIFVLLPAAGNLRELFLLYPFELQELLGLFVQNSKQLLLPVVGDEPLDELGADTLYHFGEVEVEFAPLYLEIVENELRPELRMLPPLSAQLHLLPLQRFALRHGRGTGDLCTALESGDDKPIFFEEYPLYLSRKLHTSSLLRDL